MRSDHVITRHLLSIFVLFHKEYCSNMEHAPIHDHGALGVCYVLCVQEIESGEEPSTIVGGSLYLPPQIV